MERVAAAGPVAAAATAAGARGIIAKAAHCVKGDSAAAAAGQRRRTRTHDLSSC